MTATLITDRNESILGVDATAVFSPCRTYRYSLLRRWSDQPVATFIMCNPSVADAFRTDQTFSTCLNFARSWNCGGLLVLNCFGLRSTDPRLLYSHPDPVGPDNDEQIRIQLRALGRLGPRRRGPVVCAWGNHGAHLDRGRAVTDLLARMRIQALSLGTTKTGHPRHPLYLPSSTTTTDYQP